VPKGRARTSYIVAPRAVEVREDEIPAPGAGQVLVKAICSAISPGTEMLVYRGEVPGEENSADTISRNLTYPVAYGYSSVGQVAAVGSNVDSTWRGRLVFCFQSHSSHYIVPVSELLPVPQGMSPEEAVFLPNTETAVNLVQDVAPVLGECGIVMGQGIVGLLTAGLLREFPLQKLSTADLVETRRRLSRDLGADAALDPAQADFVQSAREGSEPAGAGFDFAVELSGSPAALDQAIALTRYSGRIIVGSWYGEKRSPIALGGRFHRSRIRIVASQVSTISPELQGRWDKARRFDVAWNAIRRLRPSRWITHRFQIERAPEAYETVDRRAEGTLQVLFTY
jgi:2-desacetyl-2-hydroxyethyl bacteriochlorophyllide A dehydrogenase